MSLKSVLIFFSILGIAATFMPWLHYPKSNTIFYGYVADGIITGFMFFIALVLSFFIYRKNHFTPLLTLPLILIGGWMTIVSWNAHRNIKIEQLNNTNNNPIVGILSEGYHLGIGPYMVGVSGLMLLITSILGYIFQSKQITNKNQKTPLTIISVSLISIMVLGYFYFFNPSISSSTENAIKSKISEDLNKMGLAMNNEDYKVLLDYTHDNIIRSVGSKENIINVIKASIAELKSKQTSVEKIALLEIHDIQKSGLQIQTYFTQEVQYNIGGKTQKTIQKIIGDSNDNGNTWKYIQIDNKSREEILKIFPQLNTKLKF